MSLLLQLRFKVMGILRALSDTPKAFKGLMKQITVEKLDFCDSHKKPKAKEKLSL